jgi:hypothetical protein
MTQYREETTSQDFIVRTNEDGSESWIPVDLANSDYQRYLNPEAEQSTPMILGDE